MDEPDEERLGLRDWVWALLRVRALWPLPALLCLALLLPFVRAEAWRPQFTTRRTLSTVELTLLISGVGAVFYWAVLALSRKGLLYSGRTRGMREPSEGELIVVEAGLRFMCLLITYAGPALLLWGTER